MKWFLVITVFALHACNGSLSDDQRKEMREKMEANKIVRVTEAEITEAAFAEGRRTVKVLDSLAGDTSRLRKYTRDHPALIRFIRMDERPGRPLEQQLKDAYMADTAGSLQDNVQKVRNAEGGFDSLLYTMPVTLNVGPGATELKGIWSIWLSKKELVKEIGRRR